MSFGWSAGDIVAAIRFINKTCIALNDANGAAQHYRQVHLSLTRVEDVLRPLLNLRAIYPEYGERIQGQVDAVMTPVTKFLEKVEPLAASLGVRHTGLFRHFTAIPQKLDWLWFKSKEAAQLQDEILQGGVAINTLLLNITTYVLQSVI